jgi:hypothetical protein
VQIATSCVPTARPRNVHAQLPQVDVVEIVPHESAPLAQFAWVTFGEGELGEQSDEYGVTGLKAGPYDGGRMLGDTGV